MQDKFDSIIPPKLLNLRNPKIWLARAVDKLINKDYGSLPHGLLLYLIELQQTMQFGLQHSNFSFDYDAVRMIIMLLIPLRLLIP